MTHEETKTLKADLASDLKREADKRDALEKQIQSIQDRAKHDASMLKWDLASQKKKCAQLQGLIDAL